MKIRHPIAARASRRQQRGIGLFDGLVALGILGFGLLGLTRFQSKLVAQSTEAQFRTVAAQLADELLSTALVDSTANTVCYSLPATGGCTAGGVNAQAFTTDWRNRAMAALPNAPAPTVNMNAGTGRLTVTLSWTWTAKDGTPSETRTHTVISDPR